MKYFTPLLLSLLLSACGSDGSSAPAADVAPAPVAPPSPALLLGASSMAQTMTAGTSIAMTVNATATRPADFSGAAEVFTKIVDDAGVIVPNAGLTRNGDQYTATLFSSPSLVPGGYKGNLLIKLCRDAACATQFPGSPVNLPYDLTVVAGELVPIKLYPNSSLTTSLRLGAVTSFKTAVAVAAPGRTWTVTSSAAWLTVANASGSGNGSFDASIDASGLTAGSYAAVVDLKASDGQHVSLPATLTVLPTAFQIYGNNLTFNAINGAPIGSQALQFTLDNSTPTAWSAVSSADWIKLTPLSGTTPATATMSLDPSKLAQGSYNASLVLSSPVSTPATVAVTLNLAAATLGLSPSALTLGGANGRDFSAQPVAISLNTQINSYPWTATAAAPLQLSAASGSASQTSTTLTVGATAQTAPVGT
ncbi:MAG: quinoprotein amine dehydrogenase, partial [Massilia sp.]